MTTFQKQLAAVLQHALHPILEYIAELYEPPPDILNGKLPFATRYKLDSRCEEYDIEAEPILHHLLHSYRDTNSDELNHSGHLWKSTINFSVPTQEDHEFWREPNLNGKVEYEVSIILRGIAFESSKREANSFTMIKLIHLIDLLQEILQRQREMDDMKSLISKIIRSTTKPSIKSNKTLNMSVQLYTCYLRPYHDIQVKDHDWRSITASIKEFLKRCSPKLQPLLKNYLIFPFFLSP